MTVNTGLTYLGLTDNQIGDQGAVALGEALKVNAVLQFLDLKNNRIGQGPKELLREIGKGNDEFCLVV